MRSRQRRVHCSTALGPRTGRPPPLGANDWACVPSAAHPRPLVLVHGLGATMDENWSYLSPILQSPATASSPSPTASGPTSPTWAASCRCRRAPASSTRSSTACWPRRAPAQVDLVGHSEGTVMPQWWLKKLGGAARTHHYVALTPLYDGTTPPRCRPPGRQPAGASSRAAPTAPAPGSTSSAARASQFLAGSVLLRGALQRRILGGTGRPLHDDHDPVRRARDPLHQRVPRRPRRRRTSSCRTSARSTWPSTALAFDPVVAHLILNALDPAHATPVSCGRVLGLGLGTFKL